MKLAACENLATRPENQTWYRAIRPEHWPTALATSHTLRVPSRFHPRSDSRSSFASLYLGENHLVALFEVGALYGSDPQRIVIPNPYETWIILNVQVTLQKVADLTSVAAQKKLGTTAQELTGDWRGYRWRQSTTSIKEPTGPAPTQELGAALHGVADLEGFRTLSSQVPTHMNLVIFPDKLQKGSQIVFSDPASGASHTIKAKRLKKGSKN